MITGAHPGCLVVGAGARASVMGVHFKAGGAFPFLRFAPWELEQTCASLDECPGTSADELRGRLRDAPYLRSVGEVVERAGVSPKKLIALFREEVGLGPNAFWRVRRFQAALRHLDSGEAVRGRNSPPSGGTAIRHISSVSFTR